MIVRHLMQEIKIEEKISIDKLVSRSQIWFCLSNLTLVSFFSFEEASSSSIGCTSRSINYSAVSSIWSSIRNSFTSFPLSFQLKDFPKSTIDRTTFIESSKDILNQTSSLPSMQPGKTILKIILYFVSLQSKFESMYGSII